MRDTLPVGDCVAEAVAEALALVEGVELRVWLGVGGGVPVEEAVTERDDVPLAVEVRVTVRDDDAAGVVELVPVPDGDVDGVDEGDGVALGVADKLPVGEAVAVTNGVAVPDPPPASGVAPGDVEGDASR